MQKVLDNESELHVRIFQFPTSAIKLKGRKANYYDFLTGAGNQDCSDALLRIVPRIDPEKIGAFIDGVPIITDLQKIFYKTYITARYELILKPAYDLAKQMWLWRKKNDGCISKAQIIRVFLSFHFEKDRRRG